MDEDNFQNCIIATIVCMFIGFVVVDCGGGSNEKVSGRVIDKHINTSIDEDGYTDYDYVLEVDLKGEVVNVSVSKEIYEDVTPYKIDVDLTKRSGWLTGWSWSYSVVSYYSYRKKSLLTESLSGH